MMKVLGIWTAVALSAACGRAEPSCDTCDADEPVAGVDECAPGTHTCDPRAACIDRSTEFDCVSLAGSAGDGHPSAPEPFTLAVLGDTQGYVDDNNNLTDESRAQGFTDQVRWIVDNAANENIRIVSHVGDIVENATPTEWTRARAAMDQLDALSELVWSVNLGNHDYDAGTGHATADDYLANFGPARFSTAAWFGGSDFGYRGVGRGYSSYQIVAAGGREYLHLNLEMNPDDASLAWAQDVIDDYLGVPTIVTTHEFLNDQRGYSGHPQDNAAEAQVLMTPYVKRSGKNSATRLWNKLIRNNRQVFMTLNGHYCCERQLVQYNDDGFPVLHAQVNYSVDFGPTIAADAGWIRLIEIDEANEEIRLRSFKPAVPLHDYTDENPLPDSAITYRMSWRDRFGDSAVRFREGVDGYQGTEDTWFSRRSWESAHPNQHYVRTGTWDNGVGIVDQQALLKFNGLVGGASGIVADSRVTVALLSLHPPSDVSHSDGEPNGVHKLLVDWAEASASHGTGAWSGGASGGVDRDDLEASAVAVATSSAFADGGWGDANPALIASGRSIHFDVTDIVQDWVSGDPNYGFLLQSLGTAGGNGLFLASSDYDGADTDARPRLSVATAPGRRLRFQHGVNGYAGGVDTWITSSAPTAAHGGSDALHCISGANEERALVRFDDVVGAGAGQIPPHAHVLSARLQLRSNRYVHAVSKAARSVHRVLVPWAETTTWAAATWGGDGVQPDDVDARAVADTHAVGIVASDGTIGFDVTGSVQAWVDGAPNHGWVVIQDSGGDDRWYMASNEHGDAGLRPRLVVVLDAP